MPTKSAVAGVHTHRTAWQVCSSPRPPMRRAPAHEADDHSHGQNRFAVIPTIERLRASSELTGRGITMAFLDSGFAPHPDITQPASRVVAYKDVANPRARLRADVAPDAMAWHGTQTVVSAAGNGYLADGVYRGLASEARLVLVRASQNGRIPEDNIVRGIQWVVRNRKRYDIRILSISLGGERADTDTGRAIERAAEEAVAAGIVVVAAAGNSGCTSSWRVLPPATAASVITVGGFSDENDPDAPQLALYCSSFGESARGDQKPEIVAPAAWVAAPILPGTELYRTAVALSRLDAAPQYRLAALAAKLEAESGLGEVSRSGDAPAIRAAIDTALKDRKIISTHYQHVDGTSFAAPIVASVVAQMLEAAPKLTPAEVKTILVETAQPLPGAPRERQGAGALDAAAAVARARESVDGGGPRVARRTREATFRIAAPDAASVHVAGTFNAWHETDTPLRRAADGSWSARVRMPGPGRYAFKFIVDGSQWLEDPSAVESDDDGHGGRNSIVVIA